MRSKWEWEKKYINQHIKSIELTKKRHLFFLFLFTLALNLIHFRLSKDCKSFFSCQLDMLLKMMILSLWHWWAFNDLNVWILSVVFIDMILRSQCLNIYWCAQRFNDKISRDVHIAARKFVAVGETIEKKTAISKLVEATRAPISLKLSISNNHLDVQFAF